MKKTLLLLYCALLVTAVSPQEILQGNITGTRTLVNTKTYLLKGFVRVDSLATLIIPEGTYIYGENASQGTLIIKPGGRIIAKGTAARPIVFTSEFTRTGSTRTPTYGDWGGIILLGNAPINPAGGRASIEGPGDGYGGSNPNDSSGVMSYVRIEYPGIAYSLNNEINGLTFGGVGAKTQIDHIQVSYSGDDSYEWFGGTVNCKYLVAYRGWDDDFDTDFGYQGKLQFLVGLRDPLIADQSGSNGFESDNDGSGSTRTPLTSPTWYNVTLVGPKKTDTSTVNSLYRRGMHLRRNSQNKINNALILGWGTGILLDGSGTINGAIGGTSMYVKGSIIAGCTKTADSAASPAGFNPVNWFTAAANNNRVLTTAAAAQLTDAYNLASPNFVPAAGSPALTGGATPPDDGFFDPAATFIGAFGGSNWAAGWTTYAPGNYPVSVKENTGQAATFVVEQNYPNPFNPATEIRFTLTTDTKMTLTVYNAAGMEVARPAQGSYAAGTHTASFNAAGLPSGVYFYQLRAGNAVSTKKMTLLK